MNHEQMICSRRELYTTELCVAGFLNFLSPHTCFSIVTTDSHCSLVADNISLAAAAAESSTTSVVGGGGLEPGCQGEGGAVSTLY